MLRFKPPMLRNRRRPDRSAAFFGSSASERPHLDRVVKRPHLDRGPTGYGSLAPPRKCLVQIGGFHYPKTDYVFLGLRIRPVADEQRAIGMDPQRHRITGRGKAAYKHPDTSSYHFVVEQIDVVVHRFGFD